MAAEINIFCRCLKRHVHLLTPILRIHSQEVVLYENFPFPLLRSPVGCTDLPFCHFLQIAWLSRCQVVSNFSSRLAFSYRGSTVGQHSFITNKTHDLTCRAGWIPHSCSLKCHFQPCNCNTFVNFNFKVVSELFQKTYTNPLYLVQSLPLCPIKV